MVSEIRIYVEGGSKSSSSTKADLRAGLGQFLNSIRQICRERHVRWDITACGARGETHKFFKDAQAKHSEAFNVLLVDSEGPVTRAAWEHLRLHDQWDDLTKEDKEHCHLMVQAMEAWLVADKSALERFYRQGFNEAALPKNPKVEEISKDDLNGSLSKATKNTKSREYHKTKHAFKILALLEPCTVREAAPHCEALFHVLEERVGISKD